MWRSGFQASLLALFVCVPLAAAAQTADYIVTVTLLI